MASISATILENSDNQIKLSATRSGGCANCAQKESCAILWQPAKNDEPVSVNTESNRAIGEKVTLHCSEQALLSYIAILFLPSLLCLLFSTLVIETALPNLNLIMKVFMNAVLPVATGYKISRYFLHKNESRLLAATKVSN
jgi:positive regulator of sigma E activity